MSFDFINRPCLGVWQASDCDCVIVSGAHRFPQKALRKAELEKGLFRAFSRSLFFLPSRMPVGSFGMVDGVAQEFAHRLGFDEETIVAKGRAEHLQFRSRS